jgi:hypothetical protein
MNSHDQARDYRHRAFFIVKNVPAALSFYRDRLGFDMTTSSSASSSAALR